MEKSAAIITGNGTTPAGVPAVTGAEPEKAGRGQGATVLRWAAGRLAGAAFVLWAVATLTFFGLRLIPGDPAEAVFGGPGSNATADMIADVRVQYGLDKPLIVQYLVQMGRLATGNFGMSYSMSTPVSSLLMELLGSTLLLSVVALAVAWVIALGLAIWSTRGGRMATAIGSGLEIAAAAVPHFWLGTVLIMIFSNTLGWLPATGTRGAAGLVLPIVTLALPLAGFLGQVMRESLSTALEAPFALSARARGESETGVRLRHAVRHAALPAIGLSGWAFGSLLSGSVVVETVFARPGLGRQLLSAVSMRDIPLVVGVVMFSAILYIIVVLLSDLADRIADPRLRNHG